MNQTLNIEMNNEYLGKCGNSTNKLINFLMKFMTFLDIYN